MYLKFMNSPFKSSKHLCYHMSIQCVRTMIPISIIYKLSIHQTCDLTLEEKLLLSIHLQLLHYISLVWDSGAVCSDWCLLLHLFCVTLESTLIRDFYVKHTSENVMTCVLRKITNQWTHETMDITQLFQIIIISKQ